MAENVLNVWGEIQVISIGGLFLLIFAVTFSFYLKRANVLPGESGPRKGAGATQAHNAEGEDKGGEVVRADGYVDSYSGVIEEAGGGLPLIVWVTLIGGLIWWVVYLILNWSQAILNMHTFQ